MPSRTIRRAATAMLAWLAPATPGLAQGTDRPLPPPPPTVIGMNVPQVSYGASTTPFANLVIGSEWVGPHWDILSDKYQDKDGTLRSLPPEGYVQRFLSIPPTGPEGIDVRCTLTGSGVIRLFGGGDILPSSASALRFHVVNRRGTPSPPWLIVSKVDSGRPLRDLDCREEGAAPNARFRAAFLQTLHGYGVLRFMDWQNANDNTAILWQDRHVPGGNRHDADGIAIEDMLALAREIGADPWFVMPWNADDDYLYRFARLVRAQLPAGRHVYVEVGNEVWNNGFPVARQAVAEGRERHLGTSETDAGMRRYAQRTVEVMRLWEQAFADAPRGTLVRVLATQHVNPQTAQIALGFADIAAHVDALATAPYFGTTFGGTGNSREAVLAHLTADVPAALRDAVANRRVAAGFGKRYIAYEGGEGLALPAQGDLADQLQHDPAQYDLYRDYLAGWRREVGDTLCLLTSVARPGPSGAWGLAAWEDETPAEAPKLRAVRNTTAAR